MMRSISTRKPACLVGCLGGRPERECRSSSLTDLAEEKTDEKWKAGCQTDLRFHITEKASPIEKNGEKNKKEQLKRLKTFMNFKETTTRMWKSVHFWCSVHYWVEII